MNQSVYLAGPITGLSYNGAVDWRENVKKQFEAVGIKAFSPMRHKEYLQGINDLPAIVPQSKQWKVMSHPKGIISRDRFDATRCGVLFVNLLGAKIVSIGTVMEIAWADLCRKPIVCAIEESGNLHEHMMIQEALNFRVPTLDEAVHVVKSILL